MSAAHRRRPSTYPIPDSSLERVVDLTGFRELHYQKMGRDRRFFDVVSIKGTFDLVEGRLVRAEEQAPIRLADEWRDPTAPARSDLAAAGDVLLYKPRTDVILSGHAHAPNGDMARSWYATVVVRSGGEDVVTASFTVTGPRWLRHAALRGWGVSDPEPTLRVPIEYRLAFGGGYPVLDASSPGGARWEWYRANPSGVGVYDYARLDRHSQHPAPQWYPLLEETSRPLEPTQLAGLGPVSRTWASRMRWAGTYDGEWRSAARADAAAGRPLDYPADFDVRFFNAANERLTAPRFLRGDESIALAGLDPSGAPLGFDLPGLVVSARVETREGMTWTELDLDTVEIDVDRRRVMLGWRLTLDGTLGAQNVVVSSRARSA